MKTKKTPAPSPQNRSRHQGLLTLSLLLLLGGIGALGLLTGCGPRQIGYGVVRWSPREETLPTGALVNIYSESRINETYTVGRPGKKEQAELPLWRVAVFAQESEARQAAEAYADYTDTFAVSERQGLPIRKEKDAGSERVYKLRKGQHIKVLGRTDQKIQLGSYKDYWYRVLTEDGVDGYTFGSLLTVYTMNEEEKVVLEEKKEMSPLLKNFLNRTWRPEMFRDMITRNTIDLSRFRSQYGLTVDQEEKKIRLVLPEHTAVEEYDKISKIGYKRFLFEGSSFQVTLTSETFTSVEYTWEGKQHAQALVLLDQPASAYISQERSRRYQLFQAFLQRGTVMSSESYGTITLDSEQHFTWSPLQSLMDRGILPAGTPEKGTMVFSHFLTPQLRQKHDGAVTFAFRGESRYEEATFLYSMTSQGVQMIHVPENNIRNKVVQQETFSQPVVLFFRFSES